MSDIKVWIDQDLCTGDGLCAEIAPDVFFGMDDGLYYVKESADNFGAEKLFDGTNNPAGRRRYGPRARRRARAGHRIGRGVPRGVHFHRRPRVGVHRGPMSPSPPGSGPVG